MNKGGRPPHSYYTRGKFRRICENGKYFSLCEICQTKLCTTAEQRLKIHRKKCFLTKSGSEDENIESNNNTEDVDGCEVLGEYDLNVQYAVADVAGSNQNENGILPDSIGKVISSIPIESEVHKFVNSENLRLPRDIKASKKKPNNRPGAKIDNFLDKVNKKEQSKIHEALVECFVSCNIPFNVLDDYFFTNFIKILRPAYNLPSTDQVISIWLNHVYNKWVASKSPEKSDLNTLLLTESKNCSDNSIDFVSLIYSHNFTDTSTKFTFVDTVNLKQTDQEKGREFVHHSVQKANQILENNIFVVVSDFDCYLTTDEPIQSSFWYIKSNLIRIKSLKNALMDPAFINKVKFLQEQFEVPEIQKDLTSKGGILNIGSTDNEWDANCNLIATCSSNLKYMRQITSEENNYKFSTNLIQLLFDNEFRLELLQFVQLTIKIHELNAQLENPASTIADVVENWIKLYNTIEHEEFKTIIGLELEQMITPLFAAANFLHPKYKGRALLKFNEKYMIQIKEYMFDNITDEESLRIFTEYSGNTRYFQKLIAITQNPILFWSNVGSEESKIKDLALKLIHIPSSTNTSFLSTVDKKINLDPEQANRIKELHHTLKINIPQNDKK